MASSQDFTHDIAPPIETTFRIPNKLSLALESLWIVLLIVPHTLLAIYRKICPLPEKSLRGQIALVTGAGRGLGRGLAIRLAQEGCKVAVADINKTNAEDTAEEIVKAGGTAKAYFANVAKVTEVKALRAAIAGDLGPVDILVNNAGLIFAEPLEASTEEEIETVISVNLTSHFWMVREFLPSMKERNTGHIVAIASIASFAGGANGSAYVASKFGLRGFMECVRDELRGRKGNNIRTTTVFPYFINTSASYVNLWDLRIPPFPVKAAVNKIISGVKRNQEFVTIPELFYTLLHLGRLLPRLTFDKAIAIFHIRVVPPTKEEKDVFLTTALAKALKQSRNK